MNKKRLMSKKHIELSLVLITILILISVIFINYIKPSVREIRASPLETCGNGITDPGEACDGIDLNGYTCSTVAAGLVSGTLSCNSDCSGYDVSECVEGNTTYADSCSQEDVQAAIDSAIDGDTVIVPAGECTWSNYIFINGKGIALQGAGIDLTILIDNTSAGYSLLHFDNLQESNTVRVTGFTFRDYGQQHSSGVINIEGDSRAVRVDHNKFENLTSRTGFIGGTDFETYGVVDHNIFIHHIPGSYQGVSIYGDGDSSWTRPQELGSANAVYIEDNIFDFTYASDGALDAYYGARYVFRYNTVIGVGLGHHGFDSSPRSTHSWEVYNNIFNSGVVTGLRFHSRGGSGVIFNNTFSGGGWAGLQLTNYRSCGPMASIGDWGRCDGSQTIDGNQAAEEATGTHTASDNAAMLIDSSKNWPVDEWVDYWIWNLDDGSFGKITSNTHNTIIATLTEAPVASGFHGGSNNSDILVWSLGNGNPVLGWTPNQWVNYTIQNVNDGSSCIIASNTQYTVNCSGSLSGGIENDWDRWQDEWGYIEGDEFRIYNGTPEKDWDNGDSYKITNGYPCMDQNGKTTNQEHSPIYEWNNTLDAADYNLSVANNWGCSGPEPADHIQENRDYYNNMQRPGYVPYVYPHPLVLIGESQAQEGNVYYIDFENGNDLNDGLTTLTSWKHAPGDDNAIGNPALTTLQPGDIVKFKGGVVYQGKIDIDWSGSIGNYITYDGNSDGTWGIGKAEFNLNNAYYNAFRSDSKSYIKIENFEIYNAKNVRNGQAIIERDGIVQTVTYNGSGGYDNQYAIRIEYSNNIIIKDVTIHTSENWDDLCVQGAEYDGDPATIYGVPTDQGGIYLKGTSNVEVDGFKGYATATFIGIGVNSANIEIHNSDFGGIDAPESQKGYFNTAIGIAAGSNINIHDNIFHDGWQYEGDDPLPRCHAGDWLHIWQSEGLSNDITVERNLFYNDKDFQNSHGTAMVWDEDGPYNHTYRNNIFVNPHASIGALGIQGNATNIFIYSNTFVSYQGQAIYFSAGAIDNSIAVKNNIVVHTRGCGPVWFNDPNWAGSSDYNVFYVPGCSSNDVVRLGSASYTLEEWQIASGQDLNSDDSNPMLEYIPASGANSSEGDYHLTSNSINALDKGTTLSGFSDDYDGTPRPQGVAWDIGAYEFILSCVEAIDCPQRECHSVDCSDNKCVYTPLSEGAPCTDDGFACTTGEQCMGGECTATILNDNLCEDHLFCSSKECTMGGCQYSNCDPNVVLYFNNNDDLIDGIVEDISSYNNDGICTPYFDCPIYLSTGSYNGGGAYDFDGVDDSISVSHSNSLDITDNLTVAFWFYPKSTPSDYASHPITKAIPTMVDDATFVSYFGGTGSGWDREIVFIAEAGGSWKEVSPRSQELELNNWYHVVWTYSNGGRLYINGSEVSGGPVGSGTLGENSEPVRISDDYGGQKHFNGIIDEVMIFNRELSPDEVWGLYTEQCTDGETRLCNQQGVCQGSFETCTNGVWPGCDYSTIPNYEQTETLCDNLDNDCDNQIDEGCEGDLTAPSITIESPLNTTYAITNIDYNITVDEALSTALASIDNVNITLTNDTLLHYYNSSGDHPSLDEGSYEAIFFVNDTLGNSNSSTISFTIQIPTPPTGGGPSGGGGGSRGEGESEAEAEAESEGEGLLEEGFDINLFNNEEVNKTSPIKTLTLTTDNINEHILQILSVSGNQVIFTLDNEEFTLSIREYKTFTIDDVDVRISLNNIEDGIADLTFKRVSELELPTKIKGEAYPYLSIIIITIVIIIIASLLIIKKRK